MREHTFKIEQEDWLKVICKHYKIKFEDVKFVHVASITGKGQMTLIVNEQV